MLAEPDVAGADLVLSGGDVVPGPFPRECVEALVALGGRVVAVHGNGERNVVAREGEEARWCAERLSAEQLARMAALPSTAHVDVPGLGSVALCHGTPRSDEEIVTLVTPDERLGGILAGVEADVVLAGHTHTQIDRRVAGVRWVNGGSVGMPYEDEPGARWALLTADGVELRRTAYDREAAGERIRRSGMPGAEAFAAEYVLAQHPSSETAPYFESLAS